MEQAQAAVFDIGNVLVTWAPEAFYDREIGPEARAALFAEADLHGMNEIVDAGGPFRETVYAWADRHPAWTREIRWWHDRWLELASPRIEGSIRLLRILRAKGVPVFALTNFGRDSFAFALGHIDVLNEFDRAFVSGEMGVTKPDPRIYAMVEAATGLPPAALLFADDRPENVAAAAARGWRTHQFVHVRGWAERLGAEGLLARADIA
jgi:2-haloacid dehalogenase